MNARDIIQSMLSTRWRQSFCLPNYTPALWWECDVFELTKSDYVREFEVKLTRGDFFADADKSHDYGSRWTGNGREPADVRKKHDLLAIGDVRGPSAFSFVTPVGLVKEHEIPQWAGLIEITDRGAGHKAYRFSERVVKPAPRLHREKVSDDVRRHALGVCYYRMHELMLRRGVIETAVPPEPSNENAA